MHFAAERMRRHDRLKIAFAVHDYNRVLGHSRYVVELAERFAAQHEVHVFANRFENVPANITAHHVPAVRASALASIFSFLVPASLMIRDRFDIIHAQGFTMFGADVVTAHISNARWLEARRLLEGGKLPWRERLFASLVVPGERRTLRDPQTTVIAVSAMLSADLARLYGRTAPTEVIPHGVDRAQFNPDVRVFRPSIRRELQVGDDELLFLYVGDLRKGFETAIRALATLPSGHLAGVSRSDPAPYDSLAVALGIGPRVITRPATSAIERYYGAADVLLLPTPYDAFGMVVTEAMACGIPVITTPLAGASEVMTHGVHGLLVDSPTDVAALSAAMKTLIEDPALRAHMGRAASQLMLQHDWDTVARRTLDVYYRHLDNGAAASTINRHRAHCHYH